MPASNVKVSPGDALIMACCKLPGATGTEPII